MKERHVRPIRVCVCAKAVSTGRAGVCGAGWPGLGKVGLCRVAISVKIERYRVAVSVKIEMCRVVGGDGTGRLC